MVRVYLSRKDLQGLLSALDQRMHGMKTVSSIVKLPSELQQQEVEVIAVENRDFYQSHTEITTHGDHAAY